MASKKLTPLAKKVLEYLVQKGTATPREALLDLGVNSGSFTRRITEIRDAGYKVDDETKFHPTTRQRYKEYKFGAHA